MLPPGPGTPLPLYPIQSVWRTGARECCCATSRLYRETRPILVFSECIWLLRGQSSCYRLTTNHFPVFLFALTISIVRLYVQNYAHKMLKRPYERISFTAITMVVLALSLVVWPASFVPGFFIIPFRPGTRFMASSFEGEWWRNAHFSTIEFLEESTTIWQNYLPLLQIHYEYSDTRNMNRIPSGNILCSMGGVSFIHQY